MRWDEQLDAKEEREGTALDVTLLTSLGLVKSRV